MKNHDVKGRRKSHKETSGSKMSSGSRKLRRRFSESSVVSATSTPLRSTSRFDLDDVFDDPLPLSTCEKNSNNAMNFDEMSNCLITLMDHSSINGDNVVVSSLENIGSGYKHSDNNYDGTINYCDENDFGIVYF